MDKLILDHIPQREPFLFIEKIVDRGEDFIITSKLLTGEEDFFKGHFPHGPVMPGVLLCESVFQTGALLMSLRGESSNENNLALVTRIQGAKFKRVVRPGDEIVIKVDFKEMLSNAAFMKGVVSVDGKTAASIEFAATIVPKGET